MFHCWGFFWRWAIFSFWVKHSSLSGLPLGSSPVFCEDFPVWGDCIPASDGALDCHFTHAWSFRNHLYIIYIIYILYTNYTYPLQKVGSGQSLFSFSIFMSRKLISAFK